MRRLSDAELLNVWERGLNQSPVQQTLLLLACALPERSWDAWASMSIGRRDAVLLRLRASLFGSHLISIANCPKCGEIAEIPLRVEQLVLDSNQANNVDAAESVESSLSIIEDDVTVKFRLPNSLDLDAALSQTSVDDVRELLFQRCVLSVVRNGEDLPVHLWPAHVSDAVVSGMAEADPQADLQLVCTCPRCGKNWSVAFDIAAFLWTEITAWAKRTLGQVHILASAYGWREAEVLALSSARRQMYLEMIGNE